MSKDPRRINKIELGDFLDKELKKPHSPVEKRMIEVGLNRLGRFPLRKWTFLPSIPIEKPIIEETFLFQPRDKGIYCGKCGYLHCKCFES